MDHVLYWVLLCIIEIMMNRKIIIGVMGPGKGADENVVVDAFELGKLIAQSGWIVLSGGVIGSCLVLGLTLYYRNHDE